ncbi:MAG: hypothetical protein ACPG9I_04085 [Crocinitomicaceae bacterium]
MKLISFVMLCSLLLSCSSESNRQSPEPNKDENTDIFGNEIVNQPVNQPNLLDSTEQYLNDVIGLHCRKTLFISEEENYEIKVFKENLNQDSIIDAIITINRLDFAKQKAQESEQPIKAKEIGYMGPFNAFYFYNGATNQISNPIVVPSSPLVNLKIKFENISNNEYKDILVDYRIRNSSTRQVYFLYGMVPSLVFEHTIFDELGTNNKVAYSFNYKPGTQSEIKNILLTQGQIKRIPKQSDLFTFEPEIINTKKTVQEFFFIPGQGKYFSLGKN